MYYKNAAAALIVFDVTDHQTFEKSQTWVTELNEKAPANIIISLVGNKVDLEQDRKVTM
jgi:GTPase SAR1 family protein